MKKTKNLLLIVILSVFLCAGTVYAEEDLTCNATNLNELRTMASNIKVSYVPNVVERNDAPSPEHGVDITRTRVLDIKIYNITSKLYIVASPTGSNVKPEEVIVTLANVAPDGSATIRQPAQSENMTYTFKVFSDAYGCSTKVLRTFKLTLPRFNYYSELDICQDIPEFYLCQQYTTYKVDGSTFYDKVDDYKEKLSVQSNGNGVIAEDNSLVSNALSSMSKNKYIIVGIIVAIGVVLTILVLRKKKVV